MRQQHVLVIYVALVPKPMWIEPLVFLVSLAMHPMGIICVNVVLLASLLMPLVRQHVKCVIVDMNPIAMEQAVYLVHLESSRQEACVNLALCLNSLRILRLVHVMFVQKEHK